MHYDAKRPAINLWRLLLSSYHFGCKCYSGSTFLLRLFVVKASDAEVCQFYDKVIILSFFYKEVLQLDVTMYDAFLVTMIKCHQHLLYYFPCIHLE